jgi:hypothetical protein
VPRSTELPDDLKPLVRRNAFQISDTSFDRDSERLVAAIEGVLEDNTPERQREAKESQAGLREVQKQALEAQERLTGKEHPDTLSAMYNLARTLRAQGDLDAIIRLGFERERLRLHARRGDLNRSWHRVRRLLNFFDHFGKLFGID